MVVIRPFTMPFLALVDRHFDTILSPVHSEADHDASFQAVENCSNHRRIDLVGEDLFERVGAASLLVSFVTQFCCHNACLRLLNLAFSEEARQLDKMVLGPAWRAIVVPFGQLANEIFVRN